MLAEPATAKTFSQNLEASHWIGRWGNHAVAMSSCSREMMESSGRALAIVYTSVSALCALTVALRLWTAKVCYLPFHLRHAVFLLLLFLLFVGRVASDIWELGILAKRGISGAKKMGPVVVFLTIFLVLLYHLTCVLHSISLAKENLEAAYCRSVALAGSVERPLGGVGEGRCCRPQKLSTSCLGKIMTATATTLWVLFLAGYVATLMVKEDTIFFLVIFRFIPCRDPGPAAMASMQERLSFKRLGKKVRATLVARSSGAPSPTENSESESPVEKAQSETRLPAIGRFKAASQGLVAQTRMRSLGEAGQRSPRARLVRRHPFFLMTSRDFKEQLASAMEPLADVAKELQEPVKAEDPYEQVWDVLVPATERPQAKARVLIGQGEAVPWHLKGIILAMDEHVKTLQVLYKDTLLTPDLEDSFMVGLAGQEVALGILQESPFTVQLNGPATNLYFLSHEKLEDLSQTFFQDHTKLVERAQKILSNLMSAWVQKFYSRCFPRLFSYASQDFMTALVGLISIRVIKGGDKICREGEPGNFGFYLHAGRAVAQRGKANIIRLSSDKRSWHSWWGMLEVCGTCVEQTCTVIAEMDCMIWVLQSKHAEDLRLTFPRECNLFDKISARRNGSPGVILLALCCPGIVCYIFTGRQRLPSAVMERMGGAAGPGGFHGGVVTRGAVMEPPTREAPPSTNPDQKEKTSSWAECLIEECSKEGCRRMENWVFRKEHADDYQAFLNIRNVKPQGFLPYHGSNDFNTTVMCRERKVDVSLSCAECVRLIIGGPYGARGVAVGAYPPEQSVIPCLELSKFLPRTKPKSHERWDGNQEIPRQTAFCNVLNVGMRHLQLLTPHMDAMRSIAMFADCGKDFLEMLNSEFSQRICGRDEVIFRESEVGDEMFVLALGKCKVLRSGNNHPVSRLHPGSVFGGQAVLGISQTRKETVMADTVSDVRALSRKALLRVLEKFPEEEERILSIVEAHSQSRKAASMALEQASASEGGFSQDFTRMLVDNMFEQPFMVNQAILTQGTPGTHLVVLVHGIVEIEANGMVVATVTAPGIFGERGLLVTGSRSGATVRCTTVAECMMLPVDGPSTPVIRQLYEADMKILRCINSGRGWFGKEHDIEELNRELSHKPQACKAVSRLDISRWMTKKKKDAKKVKKAKKSKKDDSDKKRKKKHSKKAKTSSSSSSESDEAKIATSSRVIAPGIAQELRAALLRKGDPSAASDLSSQRDNALGRCDARVIHRPREEELSESQKAEREALQKEAEDA
eukprot:s1039_g8.t2